MKALTSRRISQAFFLTLFIWFCIVATWGREWWQLRGWPVNLFLEMDPLVALGTVLSTHAWYKTMLWGLVILILTFLLGRVFCGWICPFGTLNQFVGWLGSRRRSVKEKIAHNRYHKGQVIKYFLLIAFLVMAGLPVGHSVSLQTGLLDPIPLIHRSFNTVVIPVVDLLVGALWVKPRYYEGAWVISVIFFTALFMNLIIPRFYCRFICPLGALLGICSRYSLWRIGRSEAACSACNRCECSCEGACNPAGKVRIPECVLCLNCLYTCDSGVVGYSTRVSATGEVVNPDFGRRGLLVSAASGLLAVPAIRLNGMVGPNWYYRGVRPPGALPEEEFLKRCIKCGQCMRICPTNIITPGGLEGGVENLWTPVLNFRAGSSGCQLNCVACGQVCPTEAIRPFTLEEKLGTGNSARKGPIRVGMAFVDQSRCLPWSFDIPCIVCQETCPVTPKAIYLRELFATVRSGNFTVAGVQGSAITLENAGMKPGRYATGDYYAVVNGNYAFRTRITQNTKETIIVKSGPGDQALKDGDTLEIQVRLQRPQVDIEKCTGCGICEHECPVSGQRAVRVSAENESRSTSRSLLLKRSGI